MQKIQKFLRAHCYDIAAYFISTTGLLFPRPAIADDGHSMNTTALPLECPAIVCASSQIPSCGSAYRNVPIGLAVVGAHSRFRVAAPDKFIVRKSSGAAHALTNGSNPLSSSLNLIDTNAKE